MLRCPPSRISLTPSDLNGLDERLAARHSARLARQKASNIRLTGGPQRSTSLSTVSAECNVGRKRARSSVSEATFHDDSNDCAAVEVALKSDRRKDSAVPEKLSLAHFGESFKDSVSADDEVRSLENVTQRQSPRRLGHQRCTANRDSPGAMRLQPDPDNALHLPSTDSLDGVLERPHEHSFFHRTPRIPHNRHSRPVLGDIRADVYAEVETDRQVIEPPLGQRLLSSARARRMRRAAPAVPDVIVPDEGSHMTQYPTLDPAAPSFIPRTRFGSVTRSFLNSGDPAQLSTYQWGSLDTTRSASNLRIRSTSEQNIDIQNLRPCRRNRLTANIGTRHSPEPDLYMEQQRSITGFNQDTATAVQPAWDLDRYSVWRTPPHTGIRLGADGLLAQSAGADPDVVRSRYSGTTSFYAEPSQGHRQTHFRISALVDQRSDGGSSQPRMRSASPAVSTISRSTPNLLSMPRSLSQIGSRGSSWSWSQHQSRPQSQTRIPSMVSAASGVSGGDHGRRSSRQELDAAEEFIRRRNSPLDELTERFSRMRSVGHSWGRTPGGKSRPSLLNGDPFGQDLPVTDPRGQTSTASAPRSSFIPAQASAEEVEELADADPVALSLALPPSSPFQSGAQLVPSSPPIAEAFCTSPRQPLTQLSPSKACDLSTSPIVRKPLPRTATTPKISVYDDSQPPDTQPQTPADVMRSRRTRATAVNTAQQSPVTAHTGEVGPSSERSERLASRGGDLSVATFESTVVTSLSRPIPGQRIRTRAQLQRSSEQTENGPEGQVPGLEDDRRTWLNRRGTGSLDVTPPKEGRLERFLS